MKTKAFRKTLSVFLSLLMVLGMFSVLGAVSFAEIEGVPTRTNAINQDWYSDATLYGAEKWDKTTELANVSFNWEPSSGYFNTKPWGGWLKFEYPSHIYLNVGETLQGAGYMGHMTANYGGASGSDWTDFRVMLSSATWGETSRPGFSPISELISNYGHQGTVTEGTKLRSSSSSHFDFSNDARGSDNLISYALGDNEDYQSEYESMIVWRNNTENGDFNEYVLLTGTAESTGEVTFNPTGSFSLGAAQRYSTFVWRSNSGARLNKAGMTGDDYQTTIQDVAGVKYDANGTPGVEIKVTVYDKSELNSLIAAADADAANNYANVLQEGQTVEQFIAALSEAKRVLADREVTQDEIDAAATGIGDKMTLLVNANEPNYTADGAEVGLGSDANTFNNPAYHYNNVATDGYANVVWAIPGNTVVAESGYHDNYYQLDRARMKVFPPASIVLVRDGVTVPKMPAVFEMVQESFFGFDWVKYYHLRSVSDQLEMAGNWIGYNEGNNNAQWEQWPKDHIATATEIYGSYSDAIFGDYAHRNTGTPRFFWNAVMFNTPANNDTFYNVYTQLILEAKVRVKGSTGSGTVYTSSFTDRVNEHDRQHCYSAPFAAYVINYEPVYSRLADAAAVNAIIEGDDAVCIEIR